MTQGEKLEFQHQHHPLPVRDTRNVVFTKSLEPLLRIGTTLHQRLDIPGVLSRLLIDQGQQEICLALKIRVERASRIAGVRGDIFDPSRFEAIPSKDSPCRFEQPARVISVFC